MTLRLKKFPDFCFLLLLVLPLILGFGGCSPSQPQPVIQRPVVLNTSPQQRNRQPRPKISANQNPYEGSLWRSESSFGNLFRDHRARFRNDLLTITDVGEIVAVPPPPPEQVQAPTNNLEQADIALEAITLRDTLEEQQNGILRSLNTISAEVVRVLPNGNMLVRGRKIDYRQQNQVRYVTTVQGILRPADVTDTNVVEATKLVYPEVKIKRQVLGSLLRARLNRLAPLIGKQEAGLLERLSDFTKAE